MKKFLFLPGGILLVVALFWAAMTRQWGTGPIALAVGGVLVLAVSVAANWRDVRDWFRDPRGVFVLNSIFTTVLLIAVLGLINAVASFRATQIDLTSAGRNTLTRDTRAGLAMLAQDVTLTQYGRARDAAVDQLLTAFADGSRRVRVAFADPDRAPHTVRTYGAMRDGAVIVAGGSRWRKVEQPTEPALFQAITQVTVSREPVVCFATGEGERGIDDQASGGLAQFVASLVSAGYQAQRVALQRGDVPSACEVVVVAGSSAGWSTNTADTLTAYLGRGGRALVLVDPPVDPAIRAWLGARGIDPGDGIVVETNPAGRQVGLGPECPLALKYFDHPVTAGFEVATVYDRAVSLNVRKRVEIGVPSPLAGTGERAFERAGDSVIDDRFREGEDRPGPFLLAVASRFPRGVGEDRSVQEGRLVVVGDSDFLTNAYVARQGNRDFGLRILAWLAGEREARVVSLSDRQNRRTSLSERTTTLMYVVCIGFLPLLPLLAGLVQFLRDRRS